jgi:hypothetical protein
MPDSGLVVSEDAITLVPPSAKIAPAAATPAVPASTDMAEAGLVVSEGAATLLPPSAEVAPAVPGLAKPAILFLPASKAAASLAAVANQDADSGRAPAVQAELPVVLAGPELRGPAPTGRRAKGQAPVQAQAAPPPVPLLVPLLVARHADANPAASPAVNAVRKILARFVSDSRATPAINRRIRQDGRVECEWGPAADLEISLRHIAGQHDLYSAAAVGLSVSCLRTRKWLTEVPHQIRGQTVEEFNPAWAEETIDAWDLRLQQCHAYRDMRGVEFFFWARKGDGRIFSERAKKTAWFHERTSSGNYAN